MLFQKSIDVQGSNRKKLERAQVRFLITALYTVKLRLADMHHLQDHLHSTSLHAAK